ncbi:MAG: hypothetical protein M3O86_06380, partial [Actinomycetota bacterium]|nr:hypothetical protein [Actinomycetota bacterium]
MAVTAIVPLKALSAAKSRLAATVDPVDRRTLVAAMLHGVLAACRGCPRVGDVLLVAGDHDAAALGRGLASEVLMVAEPGLVVALA